MITYESLAARPSAFASLSGLTLTDFEALYQDFAAAYATDRQQSLTRKGHKRKRAVGGGTPFSHDGRTRLLMALVFLRVYPTFEVLAFFFSLHKANSQRGVVDVLATLEAHTVFVCERPAKERRKLRSVQAVMDAFLSWMPSQMCAWSLMQRNSVCSVPAARMTKATVFRSPSTLARRRHTR